MAMIGIANLTTDKTQPRRSAVIVAFRLVHGFGFAASLQELGLPKGKSLQASSALAYELRPGIWPVLVAAFCVMD